MYNLEQLKEKKEFIQKLSPALESIDGVEGIDYEAYEFPYGDNIYVDEFVIIRTFARILVKCVNSCCVEYILKEISKMLLREKTSYDNIEYQKAKKDYKKVI